MLDASTVATRANQPYWMAKNPTHPTLEKIGPGNVRLAQATVQRPIEH